MNRNIPDFLGYDAEDYSNYRKRRSLARLVEIENQIKKNNNKKLPYWHRLHNYWIEKPIRRMIPTALMYVYYKISKKI